MLRNRLYYQVKPLLPASFRLAVRRWFALRMLPHVKGVWPILPGSERPPVGWSGWPDAKKFAFVLTHDVEGQTGLDRCRQLMKLEMDLGFRSSFNFIPEGDYRVPPDLIEELRHNGFEVGVHDLKHDGKLYRSRAEFTAKAIRINHHLRTWGAVGFRSGFMHHNLDWLHDLDVQYDASTFDTDPFEPQPDGVGSIFPFWVPKLMADRLGLADRGSQMTDRGSRRGYVELPYTLPQDSTLFLLLREKSISIWRDKLEWIVRHGGMALLNVHPDYIRLKGDPATAHNFPVELYEEFLREVMSRYEGLYWQALPREVAAHQLEEGSLGLDQRQIQARTTCLAAASAGGNSTVGWDRSPATTIELSRPAPVVDVPPARGLPEAVSRVGSGTVRGLPSAASTSEKRLRLRGKRAAVVMFSHYPSDPRPHRAADALAREGVDIDVICLQNNPGEPRRESKNGINVFRLPMTRRRGGKLIYLWQYSAFILASFARLALGSFPRRYDLVHVHNMPDVLVFSALIPKALGAKVILDLHDPMPELMLTIFHLGPESFSVRLLKRLEKWSVRFADLVVTVNLASKRIYSSRSCRPEKVHIVMNSPDDAVFQFRPTGLPGAKERDPARSFVIMYHGSLLSRNGFDVAVDALELVRRSIPRAKLLVCGESTPFFEEVMNSVRKRGLIEAVQYLGPRNYQQIVEAIDQCDLGVIPNRRSTFTEMNTPTRIFEYLARGKPVIAPRAQGIQDYFGSEDLIFFELGDANDLARKMENVFFHPDKTHEMVKRGQRIYLEHTWSREKSEFVNTVGGLL